VIYFEQQFISERSTSMVTKTKKQNATEKRGKVKVKDLKLNKETVKDLTESEAKRVKGGAFALTGTKCSDPCPKTKLLCPRPSTVPAGCNPTVVGGALG
jgi:natural product precursor